MNEQLTAMQDRIFHFLERPDDPHAMAGIDDDVISAFSNIRIHGETQHIRDSVSDVIRALLRDMFRQSPGHIDAYINGFIMGYNIPYGATNPAIITDILSFAAAVGRVMARSHQ